MIDAETGIVLSMIPLKQAQDEKRCRICGRSYEQDSPFGAKVPFIFDFGEEFAHAACLDQHPTARWVAKKRKPRLERALTIVQGRIAYRGTNSKGPYRDPLKLAALHNREARLIRLIARCAERARSKAVR